MRTRRKKVSLIGSDGVGKTSIILRYTKNTFSNSYLATLGADFYEVNFGEPDDLLQLFVWDIASQTNFQKMREHYLSYSHFAIICCDIYRLEDEYIQPWIDDVKKHSGEETPLMIVINKTDLIRDEHQLEQIKSDIQNRYNVDVFATSAKQGLNIKELFQHVGEILW